MTTETPDEMITYNMKRIEQFLREGMQEHATQQLKFVISRINRFHRIRSLKEEIDDINTVNLVIAETRLKYATDDDTLLKVRNIMDARKSTLLDELESMK